MKRRRRQRELLILEVWYDYEDDDDDDRTYNDDDSDIYCTGDECDDTIFALLGELAKTLFNTLSTNSSISRGRNDDKDVSVVDGNSNVRDRKALYHRLHAITDDDILSSDQSIVSSVIIDYSFQRTKELLLLLLQSSSSSSSSSRQLQESINADDVLLGSTSQQYCDELMDSFNVVGWEMNERGEYHQ